LFDLIDDPGERRDVARKNPELVAEMRARLEAALKNVPMAGAARAPSALAPTTGGPVGQAGPFEQKLPTTHLRFVGGASSRRVSGSIVIGDGRTKPKTYEVFPVELGPDAFHVVEGGKVDLALWTSPSAPVGFDIVVEPSGTPIRWELWLDDKP